MKLNYSLFEKHQQNIGKLILQYFSGISQMKIKRNYVLKQIFMLFDPLLNQLNISRRKSCIWDYVREKINDDDVCGTMMPPDETHYLFLSSYHHNFSLHLCLWATPIYFSIFYCYSLPSFVLFTVDYTHIMMSSQKKIIRV